MTDGLIKGTDGKMRCSWCGDDPLYVHYHDTEWGRPTTDNIRLYEKICLEGFQAGLSWLTILRKRENFRNAFAGFDYHKVAKFTDADVKRLMQDTGIVRNRAKIEATINNARQVMSLIEEFGSLYNYFSQFKPAPENRPQTIHYAALLKMAQTPESEALAKDLKKRGFKFLGPTTMYAHMQAMGLVNDHIEGCWVRAQVTEERDEAAT
jgi:DNA-3-methyladenine glycosylase I